MARPALQLAAGLLLLVGLIGLSTALIAEVRDKVLQASEEAGGTPVREVQQTPSGLPVPELTLLDPAVADVPNHAETETGVTFTAPGRLRLDPGEGIEPGPTPLEGDPVLVLGPRWHVAEDRLACPEGCQLEVADQRLRLPAETALRRPETGQGLPIDPVLEPGSRVELPNGTLLELPSIHFPSGTQLALQPGAHAELPEPRQQWDPLLEAEPTQLPPGTVLTRSSATSGTTEQLADMLEQARGQEPRPLPAQRAQRGTIEITQAPDTIRKGQLFNVTGVVEGPNSTPLADHGVSLYANATKTRPGIEIHTEAIQTNETGRFEATARLSEDQPTRPYHLVAESHARPDHDPPLAVAWSDPLVGVEGEAELTLDLPSRAGVNVPLSLSAELRDSYGAPIPNQTIRFGIEASPITLTARTDADGRALAVLEDGLPYTGNYTIRATFPGTGNITSDEATAHLEIVQARIEAEATHRTPRGETTTIQGRVLTEEGPPKPVRVQARYDDDLASANSTDDDGYFRLDLPVPEDLDPGNYTLHLEAPAIDAHHRMVLTATAQLHLETAPIGPQPVGGRAPVDVTVRADNGSTLHGIPVEAHTEDGVRTLGLSDASGNLRLGVLLPRTGQHSITLEADAPPAYTAQPRRLTVPAAPLEIATDLRLPPGATAHGNLTLTVDDAPLSGIPLRLAGPGFTAQATTDVRGRASLQIDVPQRLSPGRVQANLTLPAHGLETTLPLQVLDEPVLDVVLLEPGREGQHVRIAVTVQGSQGPLSGVPLIARAQGAFEARDRAISDANGTAHLTLPRPEGSEGLATIDVFAQPTQTSAPTAHSTSTEITPAPAPWGWLAVAALSIGLAALAALRSRDPTPADIEPAASPSPTLSLRLRDQPAGGPPVWHPEEPVDLDLELTDADGTPIPQASVHLEGPPGHRQVDLDEEGRARTRLPSHEEGTHTYRARYEDDERTVQALLELRVVDYREEIDREYRQLRQQARAIGLVGPGATPRELADALGPPADELARLFERYDYSPHPVDREDYERFLRTCREVDPRERAG